MNQYMFYTESDLLNILTKRSGMDAGLQDIHKDDKDIMCWSGDSSDWKKFAVDEFVKFIFPNKEGYCGILDDGGILIFYSEENRTNYLKTNREIY